MEQNIFNVPLKIAMQEVSHRKIDTAMVDLLVVEIIDSAV